MQTHPFRFIVNPRSGSKENLDTLKGRIRDVLRANNESAPDIVFTERPGHAKELARQALAENIPIVVAVGGDGTINEVASALINTKSALGCIPRGSGNGFARSQNIPLKLEEAIETVLRSRIKVIDVGKVQDHYFFNVTGVGLDASISTGFENFGFRGPVPYFYVGTLEYFRYNYPVYRLEFDNQSLTVNPLLLSVANTGHFGNGAVIAPHADCSDGMLDICLLGRMGLWKTLVNLPRLFNGHIDSLSDYSSYRTRRVVISSDGQDINYHTDGEPRIDRGPLEVRIIPAALRICY